MTADFGDVAPKYVDEDIDVEDIEEDENDVSEADPADVADQRREVPLDEESEENR